MTKAFAWFKKLPTILQNATIVVGLISALGLIVPQIRQNFYTYVTIIVGSLWVLMLSWFVSLYFAKSKKPHKHKTKIFFPYRTSSITGLLILFFLALAVFGTPASREFVEVGVGLRFTPTPAAFRPADNGQSLMIVAEFEDRSAGKVSGFDLNGRIYRMVTDKVGENNRKIPIKKYPHVITSGEEARKVLADYNAQVLIWGSYDAVGGRIQVTVDSESVLSLVCTHNDFEYSQNDPSSVELAFSQDVPVYATYTSLLSLGIIYVDAEEVEEAISFYTEALEIATENEDLINPSKALHLRSSAYFTQDEFDLAIADLGAVKSKDSDTFYGLGKVYAGMENYALAIENFTRSIEIKPSFCAYAKRGHAYEDLHENELAAKDYLQAITFPPYDARDTCIVGAGLTRTGDFQGAIAAAQQGLKLDPTSQYCRYVLYTAEKGLAIPRE